MSTPDLCIRVTLPFQDCSGIVHKWSARCSKMLCYEHEADEEVSKTHVHMILQGLDCKTEALKRMWSDAPGKGNEFWSFTPLRSEAKYLAYMTKGQLRPKFIKNFSPAEVEAARESWKPDEQKVVGDASEHMILKVLDRWIYDDFMTFKDHYRSVKLCISNTVFHSNEDYARFMLDEVRSVTMKVYWGVNRRVPHATQYKIVAGSVFLRICEKYGIFETGLEIMKNLWY